MQLPELLFKCSEGMVTFHSVLLVLVFERYCRGIRRVLLLDGSYQKRLCNHHMTHHI